MRGNLYFTARILTHGDAQTFFLFLLMVNRPKLFNLTQIEFQLHLFGFRPLFRLEHVLSSLIYFSDLLQQLLFHLDLMLLDLLFHAFIQFSVDRYQSAPPDAELGEPADLGILRIHI